jgi:hypothetical protein
MLWALVWIEGFNYTGSPACHRCDGQASLPRLRSAVSSSEDLGLGTRLDLLSVSVSALTATTSGADGGERFALALLCSTPGEQALRVGASKVEPEISVHASLRPRKSFSFDLGTCIEQCGTLRLGGVEKTHRPLCQVCREHRPRVRHYCPMCQRRAGTSCCWCAEVGCCKDCRADDGMRDVHAQGDSSDASSGAPSSRRDRGLGIGAVLRALLSRRPHESGPNEAPTPAPTDEPSAGVPVWTLWCVGLDKPRCEALRGCCWVVLHSEVPGMEMCIAAPGTPEEDYENMPPASDFFSDGDDEPPDYTDPSDYDPMDDGRRRRERRRAVSVKRGTVLERLKEATPATPDGPSAAGAVDAGGRYTTHCWSAQLPPDLNRSPLEIYKNMRVSGCTSVRCWSTEVYHGRMDSPGGTILRPLATQAYSKLAEQAQHGDAALVQPLTVDGAFEMSFRRLAASVSQEGFGAKAGAEGATH